MNLREATDALIVACQAIDGVMVLRGDQVGTMRTPAVVVSLPVVRWEAFCVGPTSAQFRVAVVVALDEYAMGRLWDLLPVVHEAIEDGTRATVTEAVPIPFDSPLGAAGLASYELITEFPL